MLSSNECPEPSTIHHQLMCSLWSHSNLNILIITSTRQGSQPSPQKEYKPDTGSSFSRRDLMFCFFLITTASLRLIYVNKEPDIQIKTCIQKSLSTPTVNQNQKVRDNYHIAYTYLNITYKIPNIISISVQANNIYSIYIYMMHIYRNIYICIYLICTHYKEIIYTYKYIYIYIQCA